MSPCTVEAYQMRACVYVECHIRGGRCKVADTALGLLRWVPGHRESSLGGFVFRENMALYVRSLGRRI